MTDETSRDVESDGPTPAKEPVDSPTDGREGKEPVTDSLTLDVSDARPDPGDSVTFTVRADGDPLEGAVLSYPGGQTRTGPAGTAVIEFDRPGDITVEARSLTTEYASDTATLAVGVPKEGQKRGTEQETDQSAGPTADSRGLTLTAEPQPATPGAPVVLTVRLPDGDLATDATVALGEQIRSVDDEGQCVFELDEPGVYFPTARSQTASPGTARVVVSDSHSTGPRSGHTVERRTLRSLAIAGLGIGGVIGVLVGFARFTSPLFVLTLVGGVAVFSSLVALLS